MTLDADGGIAAEVTLLYQVTAADSYRCACTLPDIDENAAHDLVQKVFHAAVLAWWSSLAGTSTKGRRRWLFKVARNKAIVQWHKNQLCELGSELPEPLTRSPRATDTADWALSAIALENCWNAIKSMPLVRRRVAFSRWNEDWTSAEIAGWPGSTQDTVRGRIKVARDELMIVAGAEVPFISDPESDEGG